MDTPYDHAPSGEADDGPPMPTRAELEAVLDTSEADIVAGRTTPLAPVLARMRPTAERIRQERSKDGGASRRHA